MLLRGGRQYLGASEVGGVFRGSPPTPGTVASALGVTASPLGMSPRPMLFATPPFSVDYAFPTVPPVPTAAAQINQGMQPMNAPTGAANNSGGAGFDPNMPQQVLHGIPPSLATADDTPAGFPVPPPADGPTGTGQAPLLTTDNLAAAAPPTFANLINPFSPQRSLPLIGGVAGGGVLLLVLLLRR